jgi:DNA polymerase III epsilon subunit family exonuclease
MHTLDLKQLRAAAYQFLLEANRPLPPHRIARQLFGPRRHEHPEAQAVVWTLLAGDPRFLMTHDLCWCARGAAHVTLRLDEAAFTVVDLETTGGIIGVDEIMEIGAVTVRGGRIVKRFASLVRCARAIPAWVSRLTGIRAADLRGAPDFSELADELTALLTGAVFVAHDIRFDLPFLRWEFARRGLKLPAVAGVCTLRLARELWPDLPGYSLPELARQLGLQHAQPHRAPEDALVTARVLRKELAAARAMGLVCLGDLFLLTQPHQPQLDLGALPRAAEATES